MSLSRRRRSNHRPAPRLAGGRLWLIILPLTLSLSGCTFLENEFFFADRGPGPVRAHGSQVDVKPAAVAPVAAVPVPVAPVLAARSGLDHP